MSARYAAQRAERQFTAVEPENRLMARAPERRWNEQLQQGETLERVYAKACRTQRLDGSPQERQQSLQLAADLPVVWQVLITPQPDRKKLLRCLVRQIPLTPVEGPLRQTHVQVLWHAAGHTDDASAAALNTRGLRSHRRLKEMQDAHTVGSPKGRCRPSGLEARPRSTGCGL